MKKEYNLVAGILAVLGIILFITIIGYFVTKPMPEVIQGEVEATEYRVSGKVPGRIEEFYVVEGQHISKGDTVVHIDSPEVRAKLAQAQGAVNAAKAQNQKAIKGARKEQITGAYELWQQAKIQEDVMKKSFDRVQKLFDEKVISAQKYDETKARYEASVAQCKAAKSQYDMAVNGASAEDKEAAKALVERALGAMQEVEGYLGELYLTSPANGVVSETFPKTGELVGTGAPIMTITDLSDMWFTFNVREDRLSGMEIGTEITVKIPALGMKEIEARISYVAVRDSYATWRATKTTDMYDAKTFELRAVPAGNTDGLYPGMTAIISNIKK